MPLVVSRPRTAKRAAKVAMRVPAISNLTASQQLALKKNVSGKYVILGLREKTERNRFLSIWGLLICSDEWRR